MNDRPIVQLTGSYVSSFFFKEGLHGRLSAGIRLSRNIDVISGIEMQNRQVQEGIFSEA